MGLHAEGGGCLECSLPLPPPELALSKKNNKLGKIKINSTLRAKKEKEVGKKKSLFNAGSVRFCCAKRFSRN